LKELRDAIGAKMKRWYGLSYDPDLNVSVTCGVTEAIVASLLAAVNPGDEVIIVEPFHENYLPAVIFAQGTPVFVALEPPRFELEPDRLRRAFSNKTRAIILNTPHNPTGRVLTSEELEGVARLCQEFDVVAVTDEIYEHITYDDRPHIPIATLDGMYNRTITIGGLGKTFAVTGWRLGYACAPEPFATAVRTVHDFTSICAPAPLQYAAVAALELPDLYYQQVKQEYAVRRARMMGILEENQLRAQPPEGAYYVMADFSAWSFDGDDYAFADYLTKEVGVAAVPGSSFYHTKGMGKNQVRFAFAKKMETFDAAAERLKSRK
jgi:aspartate/methionine/tyrosine aminotransferase